jgi:hypothetical protein
MINMETEIVTEIGKNLTFPWAFTINNIAFIMAAEGIYRFDPLIAEFYTKIVNFTPSSEHDSKNKGDFQILSDGNIIFFMEEHSPFSDEEFQNNAHICNQSENLYPIRHGMSQCNILDFPSSHRLITYRIFDDRSALARYV